MAARSHSAAPVLHRPPPARRRRADGGFTMIELLMTMLVLTIVLLGLAALQINTIRQVTTSKNANEATRLAQYVLSKWKVNKYANLAATSGWQTDINQNNAQMKNVAVDGVSTGPYTVNYRIEDVTIGTASGTAKLITVRVGWAAAYRGSDPTQEYKAQYVTLSTQRFQ